MELSSSLTMIIRLFALQDSSAIHVMPHIRAMKQVISENGRLFLLKVTNPTLGPVRLRFVASSYLGEADWENPEEKTPFLPNLLVDTWTQTHVDAVLNPNLLPHMTPTETVELMSAEDSFIEFGGKAREMPRTITNWETSTGAEDAPTMLLVAQSASTAWFQLNLANAVPFALQIEVGKGSWESSLIEARQIEGEEPDRVTFDLVLTWERCSERIVQRS
jgi:hypothetical protein